MMQRYKSLQSTYQQNKDLINIGAYTQGSDQDIDMAIERQPHFRQFVQQGLKEAVGYAQSEAQLQQMMASVLHSPQAAPAQGGPINGGALQAEHEQMAAQ